MRGGHRLAMDARDGHEGQLPAVHAVNEIADAKLGDGAISFRCRDGRRRSCAYARRTASGAGPVDGVEAPKDCRASRHLAAELAAGAATAPTTGPSGNAR